MLRHDSSVFRSSAHCPRIDAKDRPAALCVAGEGLEDHHFQTPLGKVVGAAGADDAGADNGDVELC